ncbi:MAG: protein-disulfide reductase DsbD domain-containing protein, partial [Pseudomonadota bacterium]
MSQFFAPLLAPGHFAGAALAAQAPETAKSPYAEVTLLADRDAVAPGETFTVILRQKLSPGWHTYWANPGATGLATTLNWTAPEGARIGDIQWPTPQRFNTGGFIDFGFKEEALLLVDVTAPANAPVGGTLDLRVQADWLVCKDLCFPEGQRFSLSLPVDAVSQTDFAASLLAARGRAAQPPDTNAAARYAVSGSALRLEVDAALFAREGVEDIFFFPVDPRAAAPSEPQRVSRTPSGVAVESALNLVGEETPPSGPLTGVLAAWDRSGAEPARLAVTVTAALTELNWTPMASADVAASSGSGGEARASGLDAAPHGATGGASVRDASRDAAGGLGLGLGVGLLPAMLLAALGGVLLNFMPCVFPVLALKALSIANAAQETRAEARAAGLAYGAGVVASFLAFAAALVGLQAAGVAAGWGFQLQNPLVVALLAYLLVLVGLNLGGVFELRWSAAGAGEALTRRGGRAGDFFTGVLAALVA